MTLMRFFRSAHRVISTQPTDVDALVHVSGPGHVVVFQANLENGSRSAEELAERVRAVLGETAAG